MTTSPATAAAAGADDGVAPPGLPSGRRRLVLLLGALSAFGPMSLDMYLPAFPTIARDLHTTAAPVQLTITSCLIGLAVGQLLAGPVSDRFGRRRPLVVGLLLYAAVSVLCAFAPGVEALVALRLLQGLGGAAGIVISRAVVRDLYTGTAAARFFAVLMLVNGLAPILAPIVGAQVLHLSGWRGVFALLTAFGLVLAVAVALGLPETLPPERRQPGGVRATVGTFGRLLRDRAFLGCALSAGFVFGSMFAYISGSSFVLQTKYGLSPQTFSVVFGSNAFGLIAASQVSARVVGRYGPRALLTTGIGSSAVGAAALLVSVLLDLGLPGVLPSLFLVVTSVGFVAPNASALALADHPRTAGSAAALLGLAQYAVGGLAAPLVGLANSDSALPLAVVIGCSSTAAVLTRVLVLPPAGRRTA